MSNSNNVRAVETSEWNAIETVATTRTTTAASSSNASCGGSWEDLPTQHAMHGNAYSSPSNKDEQQPVHFHLRVHLHSPSSNSSSSPSSPSSPAQPQLPSTLMASAPVVDAVPTTVTTTTTSYAIPDERDCGDRTIARLLSAIRQQHSPQQQQPQSPQQQQHQHKHQHQHEQSQALLPEQSQSVCDNDREPWKYPGPNQVMRFRGRGGGGERTIHHDSYMNQQPHRRKRSRDYTSDDDSGSNRQLQQPRNNNNNRRWLIRAEHPIKLLWDFLTIVLSIANAYATHTAIRDRQFGSSALVRFCELWFVVDFLLNFVTERHIGDGVILQDFKSVWARYLTTWFVVDLLSLMPGELLYVKPIIDQQNRRGWLKKSFFRTKAVVGVTRVLRVGHVRLFGKVARHTKRAGMGANRLLRFIIKYAPKYLLFLRNMKGVVAVRVLRQVHWLRKVWLNLRRKITTPAVSIVLHNNNNNSLHGKSDDDTDSMTEGYDDDDDFDIEDEQDYQDDDDDDDDDQENTNGQAHYAYHRDGVSQDNHWEFVDDGEPY